MTGHRPPHVFATPREEAKVYEKTKEVPSSLPFRCIAQSTSPGPRSNVIFIRQCILFDLLLLVCEAWSTWCLNTENIRNQKPRLFDTEQQKRPFPTNSRRNRVDQIIALVSKCLPTRFLIIFGMSTIPLTQQ